MSAFATQWSHLNFASLPLAGAPCRHITSARGDIRSIELQAPCSADTSAQVAFELASLFNPLLNPSADRKVRTSQEVLGKLYGHSRQVVSSGLYRLQQAGSTAVEYGQIRVIDISGLNKVAGIAS